MDVMELCEPCFGKYVQCIEMLVVSRDLMRFIFNKMKGKLEVVVLKESGFVRMILKTLCSNLFDCNWAVEVSIETKSSSPPLGAYSTISPILFGAIRYTSKPEF
jgi:hypothetical protein